MSIEKTSLETYELECDVCGDDAGIDFDTFMEAVDWKKDKSNGWTSKKIGGDWHDVCPDCKDGTK